MSDHFEYKWVLVTGTVYLTPRLPECFKGHSQNKVRRALTPKIGPGLHSHTHSQSKYKPLLPVDDVVGAHSYFWLWVPAHRKSRKLQCLGQHPGGCLDVTLPYVSIKIPPAKGSARPFPFAAYGGRSENVAAHLRCLDSRVLNYRTLQ